MTVVVWLVEIGFFLFVVGFVSWLFDPVRHARHRVRPPTRGADVHAEALSVLAVSAASNPQLAELLFEVERGRNRRAAQRTEGTNDE